MIFNLPTFKKGRKFDVLSGFRPRVTLSVLKIMYPETLSLKASFWYLSYLLSITIEIRPYFRIFGLEWPHMSSKLLLSECLRQVRYSDVYLLQFTLSLKFGQKWPRIWNLIQNDPKIEIWPETQNVLLLIIIRSHWSFWAIIKQNWSYRWLLIK